jgi:UDP:flavonoid glycosyltransferase YjiC (YdhE family)
MAGKRARAAVFCMESPSHFNRIRPIVSALASRVETYVFTHRRFEKLVEGDGGAFVDLFARHTLEEADSESIPFPCRSVSFAGLYAEEIAREVERIGPALILHDAFALVGLVVARTLGIPWVTVCAGHNISPSSYREVLSNLPIRRISPRCEEAVRRLRDRYGLRDASPLSFASTSSPLLNVYQEPPEFLTDAERQAFEPVAFFGSLPSAERDDESRGDHAVTALRVYVSFGGVVWKYFPAEALAAMRTIAAALGERRDVRALISLGGRMSPEDAAIRQPNVTVEHYVDQWRILAETDSFFTHNGLNSTHEAIFHRVPMISLPFLGDQPGLARRCRDLGLAIPLANTLRGTVERADVHRALAVFHERRESLRACLETAREWETRVIEGRSAVVDRLAALVQRCV